MRRLVSALTIAAALQGVAPATTVTIDHTTPGSVWDGIVEGFPGLSGRIGGNPLSVVRRGEALDLRSVMELPLAPLAGVKPEAITAVTLTFNIDDVLATLGPGTDLNGRAAHSILVHTYRGDGEAALNDFPRTSSTAITVSTGTSDITDATLEHGGPVVFTVDLRPALLDALAGGTPFLGILWRTTDSPTGTSIDDGRGGDPNGAPSNTVPGSRMPYLTVQIDDAPPPDPCAVENPCDDGNPCTADACDSTTGCSHTPTNEGVSCDDGNACTTDEHCTAGECVGTGADGSCDDGNACTTGDACSEGVCRGTPADGSTCDDADPCTHGDVCAAGTCHGTTACGDGILDATCSEECDDGNATDVDGCAPTCRLDSVLGGSEPDDCLLRVAFKSPTRDGGDAIASTQTCTDGDPTCDDDPAAGRCGFTLAGCVGLTDPRLASCSAATPKRARISTSGLKGPDRRRVMAALRGATAAGCTAPMTVGVAVRGRGSKVRAGKAALTWSARAVEGSRDRDVVRLVCQPAP